MIRKILGGLVLGLTVVMVSGATTAAEESVAEGTAGQLPADHAAVPPIERLHATLIEIMKNAAALGFQGRREKLQPVMSSTFDFDFMAEKSAGRYWKDFTPDQKQRWSDIFGRLTIATYAGRFNKYSDQTFEALGVESSEFDTVLVRTKLDQPHDEDVQLTYRMHQTPSGWRIIDIYMNGAVSEIALRRAEYGSVLQRDGFDKLFQDLEAKITAYQNGATG